MKLGEKSWRKTWKTKNFIVPLSRKKNNSPESKIKYFQLWEYIIYTFQNNFSLIFFMNNNFLLRRTSSSGDDENFLCENMQTILMCVHVDLWHGCCWDFFLFILAHNNSQWIEIYMTKFLIEFGGNFCSSLDVKEYFSYIFDKRHNRIHHKVAKNCSIFYNNIYEHSNKNII